MNLKTKSLIVSSLTSILFLSSQLFAQTFVAMRVNVSGQSNGGFLPAASIVDITGTYSSFAAGNPFQTFTAGPDIPGNSGFTYIESTGNLTFNLSNFGSALTFAPAAFNSFFRYEINLNDATLATPTQFLTTENNGQIGDYQIPPTTTSGQPNAVLMPDLHFDDTPITGPDLDFAVTVTGNKNGTHPTAANVTAITATWEQFDTGGTLVSSESKVDTVDSGFTYDETTGLINFDAITMLQSEYDPTNFNHFFTFDVQIDDANIVSTSQLVSTGQFDVDGSGAVGGQANPVDMGTLAFSDSIATGPDLTFEATLTGSVNSSNPPDSTVKWIKATFERNDGAGTVITTETKIDTSDTGFTYDESTGLISFYAIDMLGSEYLPNGFDHTFTFEVKIDDLNLIQFSQTVNSGAYDLDGNGVVNGQANAVDMGTISYDDDPFIFNPLSGTYTIDPNGSGANNFTSFASATVSMDLNGVVGPVVFNVKPGVYQETVGGTDGIEEITGASATNTITFQNDGSGGDVVVSPVLNGTPNACVYLNGADWLIFDGIDTAPDVNSTSGYYGFYVTGGSENNEIKNCNISSAANNSSNYRAIYQTQTGGLANNSNSYHNNEVHTAYSGIYIAGANSNYDTLNTVYQNDIHDVAQHGIYFYYQKTANLWGNDIHDIGTNSLTYGMNILVSSANTTIEVHDNKIHGIAGSSGRGLHFGGSSSKKLVYNNMIYDFSTTGQNLAMFNAGASSGDEYYYNTIYINETNSTQAAYGFFNNSAQNTIFKNNIIAIEKAQGSAFGINKPNGSISDQDHNCFFIDPNNGAANVASYLGTTYQTLNDWQASGFGANSVSGNPNFIGQSDAHIDNSVTPTIIGDVGTPIAGVSTDIDGDLRNSVNPDIGADEFILAGPPSIGHSPLGNSTNANDPYNVVAEILDTGSIASASLYYDVNASGNFTQVAMTNTTGSFYAGQIPSQAYGSVIDYYIEATDNTNDVGTDPPNAPTSATHTFTIESDYPPQNLTATSGQNTQVTLNWTSPVYVNLLKKKNPNKILTVDVSSYKVYRSTDPNDLTNPTATFFLFETPDANTFSYVDTTSIINGTTYYYVVTGVFTDNVTSATFESSPSNVANGTPADQLFPAPPANLVPIIGSSGTEVVISWNDPTTNSDGTPLTDLSSINIYRSASATPNPTLIGNVPAGAQTFTDNSPLVQPQTNFYYAAAVDNGLNVGAKVGPSQITLVPVAGGPDAFGHSWVSSLNGAIPFTFEDISNDPAAQAQAMTDDSFTTVTLPFTFPFYNDTFTSMNIGSNGYVNFGQGSTSLGGPPGIAFPNNGVPNAVIAMFWDDLNPAIGGAVYYWEDPNQPRVIIQFDQVPACCTASTPPYTMQTVLWQSGVIEFRYLDVDDNDAVSASVGIESLVNPNPIPPAPAQYGLQIVNDGVLIQDNLAILISADDTFPPNVQNYTEQIDTDVHDQAFDIYAQVSDFSGVDPDSVELHWKFATDVNWNNIPMTPTQNDSFYAQIPAPNQFDVTIEYFMCATDIAPTQNTVCFPDTSANGNPPNQLPISFDVRLLTPGTLSALSGVPGMIPVSWLQPGQNGIGLQFDDGTSEFQSTIPNTPPGLNSPGPATFANKYDISTQTQIVGDAQLNSISLYIANGATAGSEYDVRIFDEDLTTGQPGNVLTTLGPFTQSVSGDWVNIDLVDPVTGASFPVGDGTFFVGVRQTAAGKISLGGDTTFQPPYPFITNNFFVGGQGAGWQAIEGLAPIYGQIIPMIRCFVEPQIVVAPIMSQNAEFISQNLKKSSPVFSTVVKKGFEQKTINSKNSVSKSVSKAQSRTRINSAKSQVARRVETKGSSIQVSKYDNSVNGFGKGSNQISVNPSWTIVGYTLYKMNGAATTAQEVLTNGSVVYNGTLQQYDDTSVTAPNQYSYAVTVTYDINGTNTDSPPGNLVVAIPGAGGGQPDISTTANTIDFGQVALNTPSVQTLQIKNSGGGDLDISALNISSPFTIQNPPTLPFTITAGDSAAVDVAVFLTTLGISNGTLDIGNNTTANPFTVNLTAEGVAPDISVNTTNLDFGGPLQFTQGTTAIGSDTVTVTNNGTADLTISALNITGTNASVFTATNTTPITVTPSSTVDIVVDFGNITVDGTYTATLEIANDGQSGNVFVNLSASITFVGIEDGVNAIPTEFSLAPNYPNPFNPSTTIKFGIPEKNFTKVVVYNALGQSVKTLVSETLEASFYEFKWDGTDNNGNTVASGIYFARMEAGKFVQVRKMTFLK